MIDRTHPLPITRQAEALGIARSTVYALPTPVSDRDLDLMKRIDRLHLEMPYAGSRMLRDLLNQDGIEVGRKHVATLMKRMEALEEAIARCGEPEIMNTDQGSQFTSQAVTGRLKEQGVRISMDGRGAWRDNVFVERLWRSVKYEEVYLHAYDTVSD